MGAPLRRAFRDDRSATTSNVALRILSRVSHYSFGSGTFLSDILLVCHVVGTCSVLYVRTRRPGNRGGPSPRRLQRISTLRGRCRNQAEQHIDELKRSGG